MRKKKPKQKKARNLIALKAILKTGAGKMRHKNDRRAKDYKNSARKSIEEFSEDGYVDLEKDSKEINNG